MIEQPVSVGVLKQPSAPAPGADRTPPRIALIGNPNTGKTTLFNRLTGLRHHTSNFPGTTVESRVGRWTLPGDREAELIDLPGVYSLELEQTEAEICRQVLAGRAAPPGEVADEPEAMIVVLDATNLGRNLQLAGEALRRRLPTVVAVNMVDLAERQGLRIDPVRLGQALGCACVCIGARSGRNIDELARAVDATLDSGAVPTRTAPGEEARLRDWAEDVFAACAYDPARARADTLTDRLDRAFTHPMLGLGLFALIMGGMFYSLFALAQYPMGWIEGLFAVLGTGAERVLPAGLLLELVRGGIIPGVGATLVFLPQIGLLFFLIALLEDTGYLARGVFVMDRFLRPFGLPGHAFVPLLSAHACALPGIMATRTIPDHRQRLATILVAPFMTCSARLPVYVLLTGLLFASRPALAALAFVGCYALGMTAAMGSALLARRTILRGRAPATALELPGYKLPSLRTALLGTYDRVLIFLKKAGTFILAISVVLWWLGTFPRAEPPPEAVALRAQLTPATPEDEAQRLTARADALEHIHAKRESAIGHLGRAIQPLLAPLGYDWQLSVGVLASFAAREVFVGTMSILVTGQESDDDHAPRLRDELAGATRDDGVTKIFTPATCWSLLVYYVLAMQCLPTLIVTAREAGGVKWALLQLAWMSSLAYIAAWAAFMLAGAG